MSKIHGKKTKFSIGDPNGADALVDISTWLNSADTSQTRSTGNTTGFSPAGDAMTYVVGLKDGSISLSGQYDGAAGAIDEYLSALLDTDTPASWELVPGAAVTGARKYSGGPQGGGVAGEGVLLTDYSISSPLEDVVTFSAEFVITGQTVRGTVV